MQHVLLAGIMVGCCVSLAQPQPAHRQTVPGRRKNLGSMVQGTVNVPVWNWGVARSQLCSLRHSLALARNAYADGLARYRMGLGDLENLTGGY